MSQSQTHNSKERELDSHSLISFHIFIVSLFISVRESERKRERNTLREGASSTGVAEAPSNLR